jgi:hypothetical protein
VTRLRGLLLAALLVVCGGPALADGISAEGRHLAAFLDGLEVEQLWPAGVHVDWETGIPDGKPEPAKGRHTHCSTFVAEAAKRLGIYILRPPAHGEILLANAQYDWLRDRSAKDGWFPVADAPAAQDYANRGYLVVASYANAAPDRPGHIAIVRPEAKSATAIAAEGPQVTQAGEQNYRSTSLRTGFAHHPGAWSRNEIRFYGHAVRASALDQGG